MSIREQIGKAQSEIIGNLIECEQAVAALYEAYGSRMPDMTAFWTALSQKEKCHADLLRGLYKTLESGKIFYNIGRFDREATRAFRDKAVEAKVRAEKGTVSPHEAVQTALALESSIVDGHFYDIVQSDAAPFRIIAERLSADTRDHVRVVSDKLSQIHAQGGTGKSHR